MAIREIKLLGDPVLRTPGEEVTEFDEELQKLVDDMLATMFSAQGVGLAAPQVGISKRVLVLDLGDSDEEGLGSVALVNPTVVERSKRKDKAPEGCLSIPGMEEVVERPETVAVEGKTPAGEDVSFNASGLFSRVLQHEIDHLDGVLFIDRISPLKRRMLLKKWQKSREEKADS
jgi:peptide deformylase